MRPGPPRARFTRLRSLGLKRPRSEATFPGLWRLNAPCIGSGRGAAEKGFELLVATPTVATRNRLPRPVPTAPSWNTERGIFGERGQGTIFDFDPTVLQPSLTHASAGPHRVWGFPYPVMGWLSWVGQTGETGLSPRPS